MTNVLVVDAERVMRSTLKERLEYEGYVVDTAQSRSEAMGKLERTIFDVILCDMSLPDKEAFDLLTTVHSAYLGLPVIMLSKNKGLDAAVDCMRRGAYDYIEKPIDLNKLLSSIRNSIQQRNQNRAIPFSSVRKSCGNTVSGDSTEKNCAATVGSEGSVVAKAADESGHSTTMPAEDQVATVPNRLVARQHVHVQHDSMVGSSKGMLRVKTMIDKVALSDARVLILGANGTGKELVAHALHAQSGRASGPFVEVNCAAIPSELIESELFGHEKGAFTSAIRQRKGKFEQADGGTLFLDEIGDMSLAAQAKVLHALQEHQICRVGSDKEIEVDVRVIAATNKDLRQEIAKGNFREDLYHRLSVIVLRVPTLKERAEDIPELIDYFIRQICAEYGIEPKAIAPEAVAELCGMDWPGNVRELRNVVERLIILSEESITLHDVELYAAATV
jgi:two-component system nitrogen regulation response regulator NtrX